MMMTAWKDIRSLEESDPDREDMQGVDWAGEQLPSHRVMLGGFSQGGAVSLRAALTTTHPLAGCIALSCYLPGDSSSYTNPASTPVFQAHGEQDGVVSLERGRLAANIVSGLVADHKFITYPDMMHEATMEEGDDVKTWINEKLS